MSSKHWIKQTTPFLIVSLMALFAFVYFLIAERGGPEGMGYKYIIFLLTAVGVMITIDFVLKQLLHVKLYVIWIIEFILLLGLVYWWIVS